MAKRLPDGMIDRHQACRLFGVSLATWANWQRAGTVRCAGWACVSGRRIKLFALADLQPLLETMRGPDAVYRLPDGRYHIPEGMVGVEEACRMFGVSKHVWYRWEREGRIKCDSPTLFDGGSIRLYPVDVLKELLAACGRYAPPYPDADQPPGGPRCWRVPLVGHDIRRREALIEEQDLPLIADKTCYWTEYGEDQDGHVKISGTDTPLHHVIMGVRGVNIRVAHLNGDTLDCRRANLVVQTRSERNAGMRKAKSFRGEPCSSRFKGVCWDRRREKWVAHIKKDQVMRNLGRFDDEIEAAEARDEAARELFGEFASLNFPREGEQGRREGDAVRKAA